MKKYQLIYTILVLTVSSLMFISCSDLLKPEGASATSVKVQIESFKAGGSSAWMQKILANRQNTKPAAPNRANNTLSTQSVDEVRILVLDMSSFTDENSFIKYWENSRQETLWDTSIYRQLYSEQYDEYTIYTTLFKSYTGTAYSFKGDYGLQIEGNKAKGTLYLNPGLNYILYAFRSQGKTLSSGNMFYVVKESEENLLKLGGSVSGVWIGTWTDTSNAKNSGNLTLKLNESMDTVSGSFTITGISCFTSGAVAGMKSGSYVYLALLPIGINGSIYMDASFTGSSLNGNWSGYVYNCTSFPEYAKVSLSYSEGQSQQPSPPTLKEPYNNATNISLNLSFLWTKDASASLYRLQLSTSSSFAQLLADESLFAQEMSLYTYSGLQPNTTYYWRVQTTNSNGTSAWSSVWSFTTGSNAAAPTQPSLQFPIDSETIFTGSPSISWNQIQSAASYMLQVSTSTSFSPLIYSAGGITTTSRQVNLLPSTTYYYRVIATNSYGSSPWSNIWSFTTSASAASAACGNVTSVTYLNKVYSTIAVGSQCWLKQNLNAGTMINGKTAQSNNAVLEKYCYNDDTANCSLYGALYEWTEAMQYASSGSGIQGICPTGWHLPDTTELRILINNTSGGSNVLKAVGQGAGAGAGTNTTGFSALLGGFRHDRTNPLYFNGMALETDYWSSNGSTTSANTAYLQITGAQNALNLNRDLYHIALAIRCIKN